MNRSGVKILAIAAVLAGGILLILPQNGVMAWMESGSYLTAAERVNEFTSDRIISSVNMINHSVGGSAGEFAVVIEQIGEYAQAALERPNEIISKLADLTTR